MQSFKSVDQPSDFSQCTPRSTTHSMSNAISPRQELTEPSEHRRCRSGLKSLTRRERKVQAELLRALFGNVTEPPRFISETSPGHTNGRMLQVPTGARATRARA